MRFENRSRLAVIGLAVCALAQTACSSLSRPEEIAIVAEPLPSKGSPAGAQNNIPEPLAQKIAQQLPAAAAPGGGG